MRKTSYTQNIVEINGQLFEDIEAAAVYINDNWLEFLGIGRYDYERPELMDIDYDSDAAMLSVSYILDLEDRSVVTADEQRVEYFDVKYKELICKTMMVPVLI